MANTDTSTILAEFSVDRCRFCDLYAREQLVLAGSASSTIASVGALVDGWVLVVPRRHVLSTAELSEVEWIDFARDVEESRRHVEATFGTTVMFEHGSAGSGRTAGCGVDHAHVHIVPLDVDLREAVAGISDQVGEFHWLSSGVRPVEAPGQDYLHVVDRTGAWIARSDLLPSQVVRRALASVLSEPIWDWKMDARQTRVAATINKLAG